METGLVATAWLEDRLGQPALRVLDGSWYLPTSGRDPRAEYVAGHLRGDADPALFHRVPASTIPSVSVAAHAARSPEDSHSSHADS